MMRIGGGDMLASDMILLLGRGAFDHIGSDVLDGYVSSVHFWWRVFGLIGLSKFKLRAGTSAARVGMSSISV